MDLFKTSAGSFTLERLPITKKGDLRAWDAADELLLQYVFENHLAKLKTPILILNDSFGALAVGLNQHSPHSWSDSFTSHLATQKNYQLNKLDINNCRLIPSTTPSIQQLEDTYNLVIIKIPKTTALLEDQLSQLEAAINQNTIIVAGGMSKHIHTSTLKLFERLIGTTTTSRATKKARLIFSKNTLNKGHQSPYPKTIIDNDFDLELINHANVFSKDHLDIGTRFMLKQLKHCPKAEHILDLGCGNGALGIIAKRIQPKAEITFVDESYMAIASAKESFEKDQARRGHSSKANFIISHCLDQLDFESNTNRPDLILCNPPFHQAHSIGDHIAWQMFKQSHSYLNTGGELWVIGNRHLAYHLKLKKIFGNCRNIAADKKFVVLAVRKT